MHLGRVDLHIFKDILCNFILWGEVLEDDKLWTEGDSQEV
jgi:hypothetical protein